MILFRSRNLRLIERTALAGAVLLLGNGSAYAENQCYFRLIEAKSASELETGMNAAADNGFVFLGRFNHANPFTEMKVQVAMKKCTNPPEALKRYRVSRSQAPRPGFAYKANVVFELETAAIFEGEGQKKAAR
jgi:hypothetical protein